MTTLLKAWLRKTEDPLEMFEILLHEYYPTIIKATGKDFIDAIINSPDSEVFDKKTLEAFKKLGGLSKRTKVGNWMNKDNPPFLLETVKDSDGYEKEARKNNLMNFRNLLEKEQASLENPKTKKKDKWDGSKYGDLERIITGLNKLIKVEDKRLGEADKRDIPIFEGESTSSKEKVIAVDVKLNLSLQQLKKLGDRLRGVDLYDFEGQLIYDESIENPLKELIPDNKALNNLIAAGRPDYYLQPANVDEGGKSLDKLIKKDFIKEQRKEFDKFSKPTKDDPFPLERFKGTDDPFKSYLEEQEKNFEPFKEQWLQNTDNLYTDGKAVIKLRDEDKKLNDLKKGIHDTLMKEGKYQEMDGSEPTKTLLDALLYAIEQERGVVLESVKENKTRALKEYQALIHQLNEGELEQLLELDRVSIFVAPPMETEEDQWKLLQKNVEEYLKQEFDNVQLINRDSGMFGGKTLVKKAEFQFLEPVEEFNDEEFIKNFKNTFGDRLMVETEMTKLEAEIEELGGEEE